MKRNWNLTGITALIGLLVLIFDSRRAVEGAEAGIILCIHTVIPSLFPFFIISMLLTGSLQGCNSFFLRGLANMMKIPESAAPVLIPAFLGGYPVGAKSVGDLYKSRVISKPDAERMLAFCSNAGPSFLFGMVSAYFPDIRTVCLLWFIHIAGAVMTAFVLPVSSPRCSSCGTDLSSYRRSDIMLSGLKAIGIVCGWVIIFRIIISFLESWFFWFIPQWLQVLLTGILELSNGCCELMQISDISKRFVICSCMLSLGGICVLMQTRSVVNGLPIRNYVMGKLLQTGFCFLLSCGAVFENGWIFGGIIPIILIILRKIKNRCGNPGCFPV